MEYSKQVLERANKAIEICKAVLQGKEIEYCPKRTEDWEQVTDPSFDFWDNDYRVKEKPTYVPFTFEDVKDLIGKPVLSKCNIFSFVVVSISHAGVGFYGTSDCGFGYLLENFTFLDGSPCGKIQNK
jgi:hypothetical protein